MLLCGISILRTVEFSQTTVWYQRVSWEVNKHTVRYTGLVSMGPATLAGVRPRSIESEISATLEPIVGRIYQFLTKGV